MTAVFSTSSPEETRDLGRLLGSRLFAGAVVALRGELGTGKTVLVQGISAGLGFDGYVSSPSFVVVNEYDGRLPIYHVDLYRMEGPDSVEGLGYRELFWSRGVALIEWAERAGGLLPDDRLDVAVESRDRTRRVFEFRAKGERHERALQGLRETWSGTEGRCSS
ncbi:MAG: tRNA (adenosine(37)-N6)-threonylcarbamoyltransferase complex ATPase subunit type 1 TsaE [Candidatus Eisenbacteria bacterium]|nr:tRNA (adenosine(37)-N6)-threonylcarbamoyltransferase complex ATPase subunit type 1 TsaE [Candidatus Eisenbacteria bacterium]